MEKKQETDREKIRWKIEKNRGKIGTVFVRVIYEILSSHKAFI